MEALELRCRMKRILVIWLVPPSRWPLRVEVVDWTTRRLEGLGELWMVGDGIKNWNGLETTRKEEVFSLLINK
jgi:hypothetical protein